MENLHMEIAGPYRLPVRVQCYHIEAVRLAGLQKFISPCTFVKCRLDADICLEGRKLHACAGSAEISGRLECPDCEICIQHAGHLGSVQVKIGIDGHMSLVVGC